MPGATPLPKQGDVFFDYTRPGRTLRLSRHPDAGVVVLSIWNGGICQATFQLPGEQTEMFVEAFLNASPAPVVPGPAPPTAPQPAAQVGPEVFRTGQYDTRPRIA
jgi:hypothetical protein